MALYNPENTPEQNLEILGANEYPGRLLVQGFVGETAVQAYVIEGRKEPSRNRLLSVQDRTVFTEVFDTSKQTAPELTIYDAMRRTGSVQIVSNGDQTETAIKYLRSGMSFEEAMSSRTYEPDEPNYTPRISGMIDILPREGSPAFALSYIGKNPTTIAPVRKNFTDKSDEIELESGVGYALQTYFGDAPNGGPIPSYDGTPFKLPLAESAPDMVDLLWGAMDKKNLVAIAAKVIIPMSRTTISTRNIHYKNGEDTQVFVV